MGSWRRSIDQAAQSPLLRRSAKHSHQSVSRCAPACTGEIELLGDDVAGLAVHIGARVASLAGPGEVLVSRTVKDLVTGSGIEFESRGLHVLKGVPDEWQIYAVA